MLGRLLLYEPLLSARYPRADGPLWVWVPLPERELSIMLDLCSQPEVDDELPRAKERKAERKRLVACTGEYVELFLDDQPLKLPPALREYRDTEAVTEQFGVRFDLSGHSPIPGQHVLKVVTRYPLDDETDFRTTYISFFVMQDGDDLPAVNVPSEL